MSVETTSRRNGQTNGNVIKRCPGFNKIAIAKDKGKCNYMKRTMCQTHICWMRMKLFPVGDHICVSSILVLVWGPII